MVKILGFSVLALSLVSFFFFFFVFPYLFHHFWWVSSFIPFSVVGG